MKPDIQDIYSDYLLCSFSQASATRLSALLDGQLSHDQVSRYLAGDERTQADFWQSAKRLIRRIESADAIISVDDFIIEKADTDVNEIVCYHFSHATHGHVRGINTLSFVYQARDPTGAWARAMVAYEVVHKPIQITDPATGKTKRKSTIGKNALMRERLRILMQVNRLKFGMVLMDIWYGSAENLIFIHQNLGKHFICPIKSNRGVALLSPAGEAPVYQAVADLNLQPDHVYPARLKGVPFQVALLKHVYTNADGSTGSMHLISSDRALSAAALLDTYHKRWASEECHKSLQQNTAIEKSPTKRVKTQLNHIFAAMIAYNKLEFLKIGAELNHFALKNQLYLKAIQAAFAELKTLYALFYPLNIKPTNI